MVSEIDGWDLDSIRKQIGRWLSGPNGSNLATILAAQRGPDSPSERDNMDRDDYERNYWGRRARKASSGEIIRQASFFGLGRVGARCRSGHSITLPPASVRDHYDKHMEAAAMVLGLEIKTDPDAPSAEKAVWKGSKW